MGIINAPADRFARNGFGAIYLVTTPPAVSASGRAAGESPPLHFQGSWRLITNVYIDGFNLYYGLLKGSPYKWLDLEKFCDQLLPRNAVQRIFLLYRWLVTAKSPALKRGPAGAVITDWVLKTEEKGSDVNLAAHLLRDAYRGNCQCAVIMSNDSDLLTPIRMAKADCGLVIGLVPPRAKGSFELKALADFKIDPRPHVLASSQFPPILSDAHGSIQRPSTW